MPQPSARTLPLDEVLARWRPGSYDPPWDWDDEERDLLERPCTTPGCPDPAPGCYQRKLERHIAARGPVQGVLLGDDGRVWDGHHHLVAARRLGLTRIALHPDSVS